MTQNSAETKKGITADQSRNIQILRGIAIIATVMIHNTPNGTLQLVFRPFENFSVGLFLFLSGYLSHFVQWHPWHRIRKIIVPYIFWSVFYTLLYYHQSVLSDSLLILKQLADGSSAAMMYYVFVYCELTLLFPLIRKMAESRHHMLSLCISPLEMLLLRTIPVLLHIDLPSWFQTIQRLSCIGWFSYFYLGCLYGNGILHIRIRKKKLLLFWIFSLLLQYMESWHYFSKGIVDFGTQMKLSSFMTDTIVLLFASEFIVNNQIKYSLIHKAGNRSFGIFFIHPASMALLTHFINAFPIMFPVNGAMTIGFSYALIILCERIFKRKFNFLGL